jgi:hypothetical protein
MSIRNRNHSTIIANRLLILCETFLSSKIMIPAKSGANFQTYEYSQKDQEAIKDIQEEIISTNMFWDIMDRKVSVSDRALQLFRICAVLFYLESAYDKNQRISSFQILRALFEKKISINEDVVKEFLVLCVDVRTIVFKI